MPGAQPQAGRPTPMADAPSQSRAPNPIPAPHLKAGRPIPKRAARPKRRRRPRRRHRPKRGARLRRRPGRPLAPDRARWRSAPALAGNRPISNGARSRFSLSPILRNRIPISDDRSAERVLSGGVRFRSISQSVSRREVQRGIAIRQAGARAGRTGQGGATHGRSHISSGQLLRNRIPISDDRPAKRSISGGVRFRSISPDGAWRGPAGGARSCPVKWCKSSSSSIDSQTAMPSLSNSLSVVPGTPPMRRVIEAWVR